MAKCNVRGTIVDASDSPLSGILVVAFPVENPQIIVSDGKMISNTLMQTVTTSTGEFVLSLIRNIKYCVNIKETGYKEVFMVPDQDELILWGSTSSPTVPNTDPTPTPNNW